MPQDQLFKELLQVFFREFLELFYPDVAARLDFERVTFLDKELFTDLPEGSRREADIVTQVYTRDGEPELVLIHIEVQTQRRSDFPYRMFEYYALLRLRRKLPVLPIALFLSPGVGGLVQKTYTETLFGREMLRFSYEVIGLPDLREDEYLLRPNPISPALSSLMQPGASGDVLRKAMIFRQQVIMESNEARRALLLAIIDRYIPLSSEQSVELLRLVEDPEFEEVRNVITSFEQRGIEMGIERGLQQGIQQGTAAGELIGLRTALLRQMSARFGNVPAAARSQVEAITDTTVLGTLLDRILTAPSLEAMGIGN